MLTSENKCPLSMPDFCVMECNDDKTIEEEKKSRNSPPTNRKRTNISNSNELGEIRTRLCTISTKDNSPEKSNEEELCTSH